MKIWIAILALGVEPILFLSVTQDFYDTNKLAFLAVSAGLLCIFTGIALFTKKRSLLRTMTLPAGFIALSVASFVSFLIASTNKVDALMSPLGFVSMLSLSVFVSALSNASHELKTRLLWVYIGSCTILGLIALYQFVGMGRVMAPGIGFLQDALWSPTGTTTTTVAALALSIALLLPQIRLSVGSKHSQNILIFFITSLLVSITGLTVTLWQFIPKIRSSVIPFKAAWAVTIEALNNLKTAVAGVGVENFVSAYTLGKPVSLITTGLWNVRFGVNANVFFHMTTIYGLIGLIASVCFTLLYIKLLVNKSMRIAIILYMLCLFFLPPTLTLLTIGAILLVLSDPGNHRVLVLPTWTRFVFGVCLLVLGTVGLYGIGRAYIGELRYFTALTAVQNNEGTPAYNYHLAAIRANPLATRYHITYSQVNLSLANSVASTRQDQNRQLVGQLIEQAISEAKTAVTLNPQSIIAWENLGVTYQTLMPIAKGSDVWAAASFQKALSLDPTNPVLLVNLGNALVHENKYDDAILAFERAVNLKPDYANAYYNMANAYNLKGDRIHQKEALTKTLTLVEPGSSDYAKAKNELDSLLTVPQ